VAQGAAAAPPKISSRLGTRRDQRSHILSHPGASIPELQWSTPLPFPAAHQTTWNVVNSPKMPNGGVLSKLPGDEDAGWPRCYNESPAPMPPSAPKTSLNHDHLVAGSRPESRRTIALYLLMPGSAAAKKTCRCWKADQIDRPQEKQGLDPSSPVYCIAGGGRPAADRGFVSEGKKCEYAIPTRTHSRCGPALRRQSRAAKRVLAALLTSGASDLADLVVPDLARYEDWSQADKPSLSTDSGEKSELGPAFPSSTYLRACRSPSQRARRSARRSTPKLSSADVIFLSTPPAAAENRDAQHEAK